MVTRFLGLLLSSVAGLWFVDASAQIGLLGRVVNPTTTTEADGALEHAELSANGDMLAFSTSAKNLGTPFGGSAQVLVYDLFNDTLTLASRTSTDTAGNGNSIYPSLSADGRYVAFESQATDLSGDPQSGQADVFRADLQTGAVVVVNVGAAGAAPASGAQYPSISGNGRYVAFLSSAANLLPAGQDTNNAADVFVRDMVSGTTERVSVGAGGAQLSSGSLALSPRAISSDGRRVVFANGDAIDGANPGNISDIYLRDRTAGTTSLISKSTAGVPASSSCDQAAISPSGRYVVFRSFATNLTPEGLVSRIFVRDRQTSTTTQVPLPSGALACRDPRVADTGDVIMSCQMNASVPNQAYLYRPAAGAMFHLSEALMGGNGNGGSGPGVAINAAGTIMAFDSSASNLVDDDSNGVSDVFVAIDIEAFDNIFSDSFEN